MDNKYPVFDGVARLRKAQTYAGNSHTKSLAEIMNEIRSFRNAKKNVFIRSSAAIKIQCEIRRFLSKKYLAEISSEFLKTYYDKVDWSCLDSILRLVFPLKYGGKAPDHIEILRRVLLMLVSAPLCDIMLKRIQNDVKCQVHINALLNICLEGKIIDWINTRLSFIDTYLMYDRHRSPEFLYYKLLKPSLLHAVYYNFLSEVWNMKTMKTNNSLATNVSLQKLICDLFLLPIRHCPLVDADIDIVIGSFFRSICPLEIVAFDELSEALVHSCVHLPFPLHLDIFAAMLRHAGKCENARIEVFMYRLLVALYPAIEHHDECFLKSGDILMELWHKCDPYLTTQTYQSHTSFLLQSITRVTRDWIVRFIDLEATHPNFYALVWMITWHGQRDGLEIFDIDVCIRKLMEKRSILKNVEEAFMSECIKFRDKQLQINNELERPIFEGVLIILAKLLIHKAQYMDVKTYQEKGIKIYVQCIKQVLDDIRNEKSITEILPKLTLSNTVAHVLHSIRFLCFNESESENHK